MALLDAPGLRVNVTWPQLLRLTSLQKGGASRSKRPLPCYPGVPPCAVNFAWAPTLSSGLLLDGVLGDGLVNSLLVSSEGLRSLRMGQRAWAA